MTKAELTEVVIQKTQGGIVNADTSRVVRREDINTMLPAAINFAILQQYRLTQREEGVSEIPDSFLATYIETVAFDSDRELNFITLSKPILGMTKNRGIRSVSSLKGDTFIETTLTAKRHDSYYTGSTAQNITYYIEGNKIFIDNLPAVVDKVMVRAVQSANDLKDDEQVPIPAEYMMNVIDILVNHFLGTRQIPADLTNNNNPNN
jgi:hypothetical protein